MSAPVTPELRLNRPGVVEVGPVRLDSPVVQGALRIPGIHVASETEDGAFLELPRNVWTLPETVRLLDYLQVGRIPEWPGATIHMMSPLLRDYQARAVDFCVRNESVVLADQMGLGKSRTAAIAAHVYRERLDPKRPVLIVAPKYLRSNWIEELLRVGLIKAEEELCTLRGLTMDIGQWRYGAKWFFCHYDILKAWWPWLWPLRPAAAIVDEAHFARNAKTQRAQALALALSKTPMRLLLTGTPILNRPSEMWNLLNLVGGRWSFGTCLEFRKRYSGATFDDDYWRDTSPTNTGELQARLETCYLRRTIPEVGLELPPIERRLVEVEMSAPQAAQYAEFMQGKDPRKVTQALLEHRASRETLRLIGASRKMTSRAKREATIDQAWGAVDQGERVVVFTWERQLAEAIANARQPKTPGLFVHGGMSTTARDEAVARFRSTDAPLLAATFGALGVGVNLQMARIVVMHDLDWTPAILLQAEGRVYRPGGQLQNVISCWMVAKDTLDAMLARAVLTKADMIAETLKDKEPATLREVLGGEVPRWEDEVAEMIGRWRNRWKECA